MGSITVVGLGPGNFGLLTMETWEKISTADYLCLRTSKHPTVEVLKDKGLKFRSYDKYYETKDSFAEVYQAIVEDCLKKAKSGKDIVYAVPGSPLVAEKTVTLLQELVKTENIDLTILPGMSFMEVLYVKLGVDPINGLMIIDSGDIHSLPADLKQALVVTQVYNRQIASEAKLSLMERYPDDFMVTLVRNLGLADEEIIEIPLYELDRQENIDHLTSLYVPPVDEAKTAVFELAELTNVMATLRSPGGCLWDIEQNHQSLRKYIIEEVYEVLEAIDLQDSALLCEELGDLLLQIVFHARVAEESGEFSMQDVIDGVTEKLIRRHPHVFGEINVKDAGEVVLNWDKIKKAEKKGQRERILDGIPKDLPSLARASKLQGKAAKVGFDWTDIKFVWDKLAEEIIELRMAMSENDFQEVEAELGDVIFTIVNLARFLKVDAEVALNRTNNKFMERFSHVEDAVKNSDRKWNEFTLKELDDAWNEAKVLKM